MPNLIRRDMQVFVNGVKNVYLVLFVCELIVKYKKNK